MRVDWAALRAELAIWRHEGLDLPIWWRDDDAVEDTPELRQMVDLATELSLPVHLAVIPKLAAEGLAAVCADTACLVPVVHGWAHVNHAGEGQKKAEFGALRAAAEGEISQGLVRVKQLFKNGILPFFVPPWNRIDAGFLPPLAAAGYLGVSTYTPRRAREVVPGLVQINTHMDPIFWKQNKGLVPPEAQVSALVQLLTDRRMGRTDAAEPLGMLTHHLVQDAPTWEFTRACLSELLSGGARVADLAKLP
tara:strand:- start:77771 stop:78520 length:750 start_codon:yes stop_codon:yes gene_type:complete